MAVQPLLRTPLTDLTSCLLNHQHYGKCAQFEMEMVECMEAYGVHQGMKRCKPIMDDFNECVSMNKQIYRIFVSIKCYKFFCQHRYCFLFIFQAMDVERRRQYKAGERKEIYAPPPRMDAY